MKRSSLIAMAAAMVCLVGCTSTPPLAVVDPVGPAAGPTRDVVGSGWLQVYSATETDANGEHPDYYLHTDYVLCDAHGKFFRRVRNHVDAMDEVPALVSLPAGSYPVQAEAEGMGGLAIPVVVKPGQTTVLHLDEGWRPPANGAESALVRLPDGEAIGWRADLSEPK